MKNLHLFPLLAVGIFSLPLAGSITGPAIAKPVKEPPVNLANFSPKQQTYLTELLSQVSSKLYLSRILHQPETYLAVGEQICLDMRQQGYEALVAQQTHVAGPMALRGLPQGNGSYRGQLQLQMGRTMLESARKNLCPDAPLTRP